MDRKEITQALKSEGLDVAEDMAEAGVRAAIKLLRVVLPKVSTGFGIVFSMFIDVYEEKIYEMIDRIDGKVDN